MIQRKRPPKMRASLARTKKPTYPTWPPKQPTCANSSYRCES